MFHKSILIIHIPIAYQLVSILNIALIAAGLFFIAQWTMFAPDYGAIAKNQKANYVIGTTVDPILGFGCIGFYLLRRRMASHHPA